MTSLTVGTGNALHTWLQEAIEMKFKHETILTHFTAKFSPDVMETWITMINAWDLDHTKRNPYEEPQNSILLIYLD